MGRWSSPKDPALEAALRRNRRWIVNNQIKRLLLRFPSRSAPVRLLQSRFKTLDLLGRAANWLRKYPSCFDLFTGDGPAGSGGELCFGFTKRMAELVDAEEAAVAAYEQAMADRLARLLMLARGCRLQVSKLAALRGPLGLPDDYLLCVLLAHTDLFRLANPYPHRRNAAELDMRRGRRPHPSPSVVVQLRRWPDPSFLRLDERRSWRGPPPFPKLLTLEPLAGWAALHLQEPHRAPPSSEQGRSALWVPTPETLAS